MLALGGRDGILAPQPRGGELDRLQDVLVAGAAAEVAGEPVLDLLDRGVGDRLQQLIRHTVDAHVNRSRRRHLSVLLPNLVCRERGDRLRGGCYAWSRSQARRSARRVSTPPTERRYAAEACRSSSGSSAALTSEAA